MSNIYAQELNKLKREGFNIEEINISLPELGSKVKVILRKKDIVKEIVVANDSDFTEYMLMHDQIPTENGNTKLVFIKDKNSYIKNKIRLIDIILDVNKLIENKVPPNPDFIIPKNLFDVLFNFIQTSQRELKLIKNKNKFSLLNNDYKEFLHYFSWNFHIKYKTFKSIKPIGKGRNTFEVYFDTTKILLQNTFIEPMKPGPNEYPKDVFKLFLKYYQMSPLRFEFITIYSKTIERINKLKRISQGDLQQQSENLFEEYSSLYELAGKMINFIRFMHEILEGNQDSVPSKSNDQNIRYLKNTIYEPLIECLIPIYRNPRYHIEYKLSDENNNIILYDTRPYKRKIIDKIPVSEFLILNQQIQILIEGIMASIMYFEIRLILILLTSPPFIFKLNDLN